MVSQYGELSVTHNHMLFTRSILYKQKYSIFRHSIKNRDKIQMA